MIPFTKADISYTWVTIYACLAGPKTLDLCLDVNSNIIDDSPLISIFHLRIKSKYIQIKKETKEDYSFW